MHVGRRSIPVTGVVALLAVTSVPGRVLAQGRAPTLLQAASCPVPGANLHLGGSRTAAKVASLQAGQEAVTSRRHPVAQITRSERADATFEVRPGEDGAVQLNGRRGDLEFTKSVLSDGTFTLSLSAGGDRVTIAVTSDATVVTRGRSKITLSGGTGTEEQTRAVRRLLADSNAVLRFRALAAVLLIGDEWSAPAVAVMMADATVGALTGDVGAPGRAAQHLSRRGRARARPVAFAVDCFYLMETRFVQAWDDYVSCYFSVQDNPIYANLCAWRWTLQVESYWFSFISCSGFSGATGW